VGEVREKFSANIFVRFLKSIHVLNTQENKIHRHFCKLNSIDSRPGFLLSLCKTFECLLFSSSPPLFAHMTKLGVRPLEIVFPWIHFAFSTFLDVEQVLLLWDRIIGFDTLEIVPVLAVAVLIFKSEMIMCCKSEEEIKDVLEDGKRLKVVPLLQAFLFQNELRT